MPADNLNVIHIYIYIKFFSVFHGMRDDFELHFHGMRDDFELQRESVRKWHSDDNDIDTNDSYSEDYEGKKKNIS